MVDSAAGKLRGQRITMTKGRRTVRQTPIDSSVTADGRPVVPGRPDGPAVVSVVYHSPVWSGALHAGSFLHASAFHALGLSLHWTSARSGILEEPDVL